MWSGWGEREREDVQERAGVCAPFVAYTLGGAPVCGTPGVARDVLREVAEDCVVRVVGDDYQRRVFR